MRGLFFHFFSLVLIFSYLNNVAVAEDTATTNGGTNTTTTPKKPVKKKKKKYAARKVASASMTANDGNMSASVMSPNAPTLRAYIGPGLIVAGGSAGFAINFGATTRLNRELPVFVGGDLGIDFLGGATVIQLLPTAYYMFEVPTLRTTRFYGGISMGPAIASANGSVIGNVGQNQISFPGTTTVLFELLFRPGAEFDIARNFTVQVEPKFGLLGSGFAFIPQANAVYAF